LLFQSPRLVAAVAGSLGNMSLHSSIALFLATTISALGAGYLFSPASFNKSPDGKWELICKTPANSEADARHVLLLKRIQGGVFELRRVEGNGCLILWSPDSSRIAVTDRWASDRSDVLIYSVAHPRFGGSLAKHSRPRGFEEMGWNFLRAPATRQG